MRVKAATYALQSIVTHHLPGTTAAAAAAGGAGVKAEGGGDGGGDGGGSGGDAAEPRSPGGGKVVVVKQEEEAQQAAEQQHGEEEEDEDEEVSWRGGDGGGCQLRNLCSTAAAAHAAVCLLAWRAPGCSPLRRFVSCPRGLQEAEEAPQREQGAPWLQALLHSGGRGALR